MRFASKAIFACLSAIIASANAGVVVQGQNSTTALAFAGAVRSTDLINANQPSLAAATVTAPHPSFPGGGITDGICANTPTGANTFFPYDTNFPATATYQLNLEAAPNGYNITSITSLMGWYSVSQRQANQDYIVEVSVVGSVGYKPIARVNYAPFTGSGGNYETQVTLTENTSGVLAANVDGIRFLFGDPGYDTATPGTVIREIDVQGTPSAAAPPAVTVQTVSDFSEADEAYATEVSNNDLVNAGQTTLAGFTTSTTPTFGVGGQNDGTYGLANLAAASWYKPAQMPATLTFELNTAAAPTGYAVTAIRTFAGWKAGGTQSYANQKYTVEYRPVSSGIWTTLETVDYSPFSTLSNTPANTRVSLTKPGGDLLTGVAALRFTFQIPTRAGGTNNGTVLQEIDVIGYPVGGEPAGPVIFVSTPTQRQIVQRGGTHTASIPITGTYTGAPDRIEARAVVMASATNSGTSTAWTTLVAAPSGGAFSGTLANVTAGGWYQLEVRSVTGTTPGATTVREKVGVGDIYVTAGQSNSTNYGSPALTPTDDRVVVRTGLTGNSWRHGYDPMPTPDGSSGGSVWSRLGGLLAAADNIPVGFLCAGWGATATNQWVPGTSNYTNLKTGIQSFPAGGFRAVLWHQGESDSLASTTPATYQSRMQSIIDQSRTDAGWTVPWYLAEVGFHPSSTLAQEEPVVAGQRRVIYADPAAFPGPVTDDFHREGKLTDTVHFNAVGLADHAAQWAEVLGGTAPLAPKNGDFESNTALADGGIATINTGAISSPSVIGWRALAASGEAVADGSCGYYNPNDSFYPGAADGGGTAGVLANMSGRHVGFLSGSTAGAHFLQTRRAMLGANRTYTLTVAIGVRENADTFGGAILAILADGGVIGSRTITLADLNALNAGNAAGKFTNIALMASTGFSVTTGKPLAVRITKTGGESTYLDFDQVRLTSALTPYTSWADSFAGLTDKAPEGDPDGDGIKNLVEYVIGGDPRVSSAGFLPKPKHEGGNLVLTYKRNDASNIDTTQTGQWSVNLTDWVPLTPEIVSENGNAPDDMKIVIPVSHALDGKLFGRLQVTKP